MSVQDGNDVQVAVGLRLAEVRAKLNLRNADFSEALTAHAGKRITHSRVSEAEHGRANLCQEYVQIVLAYLLDKKASLYNELELDADFKKLVEQLPTFGISNHSNAGQEGNPDHGPLATPLFRFSPKGVKRKGSRAPSTAPRESLSLSLSNGELRLSGLGIEARVVSFEVELDF